jgi:hypothetical protein
MISKRFFWVALLVAGYYLSPEAQTDSAHQVKWLQPKPGAALKASAMLQLWSTYTLGQEVYDASTLSYRPVDNRLNVYFRRARLLMRGEPYEGFKYYLAMHFDQAGHDLLSATQGPNNNAEPAVGIWDAFIQWKLPVGKDLLHLTAGWFRPQFQRESITTGWGVSSLEKSMSQNYVRTHLTGRGPGRAAGLNLGGMVKEEKLSLLYNVGVFNPLLTGLNGNSVGVQYAPLLAGRISLAWGDPEMEQYGIAYGTNFFNERKGISIDLNISRQGTTDQFQRSGAWGPGILLNYGRWSVDGEWLFLQRQGLRNDANKFTARSGAGHIRAGYNISIGKFMLQPSAMIMRFEGAMDAAGQADARALKLSSGKEQTIDFGLNYYLRKRDMVLQLHYTLHSGEAGAAADGSTVNAYFNQNTIGAIRRGNWIGLGMNAVF